MSSRIDTLIEDIGKSEETFNQILSFEEYLKILESHPKREWRTNSIYLKDMFNFFGRSEDGGFNLFKRAQLNSPPLRGQINAQNTIYQKIANFIEEGYNNRFILLIGPNGSSKSSIVKKIMHATEDYSRSDEGALFTFSWIFPIEQYVKGSLGLTGKAEAQKTNSFAHLDDTEISAILTSELRDHPALLIPLHARQKLIEDLFQDDPELLEDLKKTYLYNGDISKRNRLIFDALLKNYKGNYEEVYRHIRIERYDVNKRYSSGAVTIEPQMHVDATIQQITMDKRLASLPPSLQSLNLFNLGGETIMANRGILEFSDLFKRPIDTFKYLLTTMETKTLNLRGILTELDIFFIGTSNEIHFAAFKQHPDFNSFRGRFNFIKVPYLLNTKHEQKIYQEQIDHLKDRCFFEPLALDILCTWAVMTRLRRPQSVSYPEKQVAEIVSSLNPLEKALLLADGSLPDRLDSKQRQIMRKETNRVQSEFVNDAMYEGKFGISPREIKQIIYELSVRGKSISFIEVIEYLRQISELKSQYDFLNIAPQEDYHNPKKSLELIQNHALNILDSQVREGLGLVDDRSYESYIERYVLHVKALIKNEKIKNPVTGKFELGDQYIIKEFESKIDLKDKPEDFRSILISRLGAYSLDNPGQEIIYTDVFADLVKKLQESFRSEQKKIIDKVSKNLVFFQEKESGKSKGNELNKDNHQLIENILKHLQETHKYSREGALRLLDFLIQKRY